MVRPRQVTDEQVLEIAREVFLEHGPKAPVSIIAGRLGVSDAALFKRFGTKQNLVLAALLPPEEPDFLQVLEGGPGPGDIEEQLVVVARRLGAGVANAKGADLTSARLFGADLRDADLHRSDLRWADLRGADLRGAKLDSADLRDADLSWADLRGVDLSTTRMDGARLTQARHSRATRWPKGLPGKASGAVAIDDKAPCARCCAAFEAGLEHERARRSGLNQPGVGDVRLLRVFLAPFDPRLPRSLVSEARAGATDPWGGRLRQAYLRQSDSSSTALDKASRLLELAGPDALSAFLAGRSSAAANKARRTKASAAWGCR